MKLRFGMRNIGNLALLSAIAASTALLPYTSTLHADEPAKPTGRQAVPGAAANPGAPRGAGGQRGAFSLPPGIKLTDEQQAKIRAIEEENQPKQVELNKKRDAILTDEQKTKRAEIFAKAREAGQAAGPGRQGPQMAELLNLNEEQKTKMNAINAEGAELRRVAQAQMMAILTDEQKAEVRKLQAGGNARSMFSFPPDIKLTDDQKAKLKALDEELTPKLTALAEKEAVIMTDERRAAREAAMKSATEGGKTLRDPGVAESLSAALKLNEAEKTQLAEIQKGQNELRQEAQKRKQELLTADQKEQLQKLNPPGRGRN